VAAGLIILALVAGVIGTAAALVEARSQRDAAVRAEKQADDDRERALTEFRRAEQEAGRARAAEADQKVARGNAEAEAVRARAAEEAQKAALKQAEVALIRTDGLRLASEANFARPENPGRALLLGLEAVRRYPHHLTYTALYDAAADLRERRALPTGLYETKGFRLSPDGTKVLVFGSGSSHTVVVIDLATGKQVAGWHGFGGRVVDTDWSPDGARAVSLLDAQVTLEFTDGQKPERATFTERVAYVWDTRTGRDLLHLRGHEDTLASARFNPDGTRIVTASWDGTARVWDAGTGRERRVLRGHVNALAVAQFSPDGKRVLTVSSQQQQSSYRNPDTGQARRDQIPNPDPGPTTRPFRPTGSSRSSGSTTARQADQPLARLWDAETGEEKGWLDLEDAKAFARPVWNLDRPQSVAFSPDGSRVAIGFMSDRVAVWDATGGTPRAEFRDYRGRAMSLTFSPDGSLLAMAGDSGAVLIWDVDKGQLLRRFEGHGPGTVSRVRFSPDGRRLVSAGYDQTARVWQVNSGKELAALRGHTAGQVAAEFLPDGETVVTVGDDTVRLWSVAPASPIPTALSEPDPPAGRLAKWFGSPPARHAGSVTAVAFASDGRSVYTGAMDNTVRRWDSNTGRQTAELLKDLRGEVKALAIGPGGAVYIGTDLSSYGYTAEPSGDTYLSQVHRWDPSSGKAARFLKGQTTAVEYLELSADGRRLLVLGSQRLLGLRTNERGRSFFQSSYDQSAEQVSVWDAQTGDRLCGWPAARHHQGRPRPRFSPDGNSVLYLTDKLDELALYDARTGQRIRVFPAVKDSGNRWGEARFSPDGRIVVGQRSADRNLWFWDAATGERLGSYVNPRPAMNWQPELAFSPDSTRLALTAERVVHVVDVATRTGLAELRGHESAVTTVQFSPDGTRLLTGSEDKTAALWDVAAGRLLAVYRGHAGVVRVVAFSPDGRRIATASPTETLARVWPAELIPDFEKRKPRELTAGERVRYELPAGAGK
jgi:WD40 repeat protein